MKTKAIVFVDVQKDFIDGALRNEQAIEVTPKIVEFAKKIVDQIKAETGTMYKLYATRDTHEKTKYNVNFLGEGTPVSGYFATLEGQRLQIEHCIEGTIGWMIDERLYDVLDGNVTIVNKPTFGSFDLAEIIAEDFENTQLDEILICGFCTDICVVSNALLLRAKFPNTKISVLRNLCAGVTPASHEKALDTMRMCQIDINY